MLNVFFTVDVEVWCDGWTNLDQRFPDAFRRYVYGPTARGNFGLPYTLDVLADHGLRGVFFIESLFSTRFGAAPLQEIVGLVAERGQEVQLHLHTEWVDESRTPLLAGAGRKRPHLRDFSQGEQQIVIAAARQLLELAGGTGINAFRAGNFGFNRDTLTALSNLRIAVDSSYNATMFGPESGVAPGQLLHDISECEGVAEVPMTTFNDGTGWLRHAQLTACSFQELEGLLWQALESGRKSFCILSHNFELMDASRTRSDSTAVRRLHKLCEFLARESGSFNVRGFTGMAPPGLATCSEGAPQPEPLQSPLWRTGGRFAEQAWRRFAS